MQTHRPGREPTQADHVDMGMVSRSASFDRRTRSDGKQSHVDVASEMYADAFYAGTYSAHINPLLHRDGSVQRILLRVY